MGNKNVLDIFENVLHKLEGVPFASEVMELYDDEGDLHMGVYQSGEFKSLFAVDDTVPVELAEVLAVSHVLLQDLKPVLEQYAKLNSAMNMMTLLLDTVERQVNQGKPIGDALKPLRATFGLDNIELWEALDFQPLDVSIRRKDK